MYKRRQFLRNAGLGSIGALSAGLQATGKPEGSDNKPHAETVRLGSDVVIDFLTEGNVFSGIGAVRIGGIHMRNPQRPMFVKITTPEAVHLTNYTVLEKNSSDAEIMVRFQAEQAAGDNMDWMLHTVRNRRHLADWTEKPKAAENTSLQLRILPVTRQLGPYRSTGFSYQYSYNSSTLPIYKLLDRSSWEINGSVIGNSCWMRNGVVGALKTFHAADDFYSTEWYLPGIANPNIFQFHPLQTALQGFTFTTSPQGVLVTWATKAAHIRTLLEKPRGKTDLLHYHEHCQDLDHNLATTPIEVLWFPGAFDRVAQANVYQQVRELVHDTLHRDAGMIRERIGTYGVIEEWKEPDFDRYISKGLPKLLEAGVKTIFLCNQCENAMNTWGLSNMCCNVDYKISAVAGEEKVKQFCESARAADTSVEMWGNTALSSLTELFSHPDGKEKGIRFLPYKGSIMEVIDGASDPWVRNPSNAIEADHYTPRFCALNLRDASVRTYWMTQWKHFHDHIGIGGIFLDSSFNMSSDKFHFRQSVAAAVENDKSINYRPEHEPPKLIHTQYHAHLSWMAEMQQMGYHYCGEDLGVFGINRTGPDVVDRAANLFMWQDSYCNFDEQKLLKAGLDPMQIFFKGLAYRMMWMLYWDVDKDILRLGTENPLAFRLLTIYNEVNDYLCNREILADEKGVLYTHENKKVLWSFASFAFPSDKRSRVHALVTGRQTNTSILKTEPNEVYLFEQTVPHGTVKG